MKTLLIAEDEKMIRQGLKAMIKRSGVEVEEILECQNGEEALEILEKQEVAVLFTDIRMPKMDGLTLLNKLNERKISPEVVVISGYDDFSYAVEALKCGAREYILKPVNREDIYKIVNNLEQIILEKAKVTEKIEAIEDILQQQIKYILLNPSITRSELKYFEQGFKEHWINTKAYKVFCFHEKIELSPTLEIITCYLEDHYAVICSEKDIKKVEEKLREKNIGVSSSYHSIQHLRIAYEQALLARRYAYIMNLPYLNYEDIPIQKNTKIEDKDITKLVQLIGTQRKEEFEETFMCVLGEDSIEGLIYEDFEKLLQKLTGYILEAYGTFIDIIEFKQIKDFYQYADYKSYQAKLKAYLLTLNEKICEHCDNSKNNTKLEEAVAYIHKNYEKDLNMAMVSNHISMNYSCFSQIFKEHTGMNFVNYIKEVRVNKAKELLSSTQKKVAEVGYAVGYENEKHFMKVFRSVTGISPTEYRKNSGLVK